jgi:hypothetical protein
MEQGSVVQWFAKCGLSTLLLLLGCGFATAWFGNRLQLPATQTRDLTLITLNRYVNQRIPDVVLVGSSLTFRLQEEYFETPRLRNLALAGGSPVTGFEVVANQPQLPGLILVEMNVLSRATDADLVEKFSKNSFTEPWFFRPVRTAVAAYENWLHAPLTHAEAAFALNQLLGQPPSDFDNSIYADRAFRELNAEDPTDAVRSNTKRIRQLIASIEPRGARVLLFELPYSERIEAARSVELTRELVHAAFPDPDRWLRIDFSRAELRWADSVHLDERSAILVARLIDKVLASLRRPA